MKGNNDHIIVRKEQTLESWIQNIMEVRQSNKYNIQYRSEMTPWYTIDETHKYDFYGNEYRIIKPRYYIISIKDNIPTIEETSNCWSSSAYGRDSNGTEYFLMEEVGH